MSDWSSLPANAGQIVVKLLRWQQAKALSQVNKHWNGVVRSSVETLRPSELSLQITVLFPCITDLDVSGCWDAVDDVGIIRFVRRLGYRRCLKSLNLSKCHNLTNKATAAVAQFLPQLETLILTGCREPFPVPAGNYCGVNGQALDGLVKLRHLDLRWDPVTDESMASVARLTLLTQLVLGECPFISNQGVKMLRNLTQMKVLYLDRTMVSGDGLQRLLSMESLRKLSLANCSRVRDEEMLVVAQFSSLESLILSRCDVSDYGVGLLSSLPKLKELDLSHCMRIEGSCFEGFEAQATLMKLKLRDCYTCCVSGTLESLSRIKSLREVDLTNCSKVSVAGITHMLRLPLVSLNLSCCGSLAKGSSKLANLLSLKELDISFWDNLRDEKLASLAKLTNLESLNLSKCSGITDKGILNLRPLGCSLKHINCSECHNITSQGVRTLAKNFPKLESLGLAWLGVKNADCRELRKLSNLTHIDFTGCLDLNIDGLQELWYVDGVFDAIKTPRRRVQ